MDNAHIIETPDENPIIEHEHTPWKKFVAYALLALIILALLFALNNQVIAPQNNNKMDQIPSESQLPTTQPNKDSTNSAFICPTSEWINCMPGPGPQNHQCKKDYLQWAQQNCPG